MAFTFHLRTRAARGEWLDSHNTFATDREPAGSESAASGPTGRLSRSAERRRREEEEDQEASEFFAWMRSPDS
jgi:hypothetical protein